MSTAQDSSSVSTRRRNAGSPAPSVGEAPRRRRVWPVPVALLVLTFLVPSLVDWQPVLGGDATQVIREVLFGPLSESVPALLPIAKVLLLAVAIVGVAGVRRFPQVVLGYYAAILVVVAFFQNSATITGGFAVLLGNLVVQLVVAAVCVVGLRSTDDSAPLLRGRLWVLVPMLVAWAYPFAVVDGAAVAGGWSGVLANGAGVTYCMVTPIIAGLMLLRPTAFDARTRLAVGALGTVFGLLNMTTWFGLSPESWWMGVLHIPLLVLSGYCLVTAWRDVRAGVGQGSGTRDLHQLPRVSSQ